MGAPDEQITSEIKKWRNASVNGKMTPLEGLVKRRAKEVEMWME
jgi:hypothetical protein